MTLSLISLAVKNLRHNSRSYAAFFLSSTFAVWMFYLFGSLVDHPDLMKLRRTAPSFGKS
jgi:hypothetical protein